jgi:TatD DNase family protein
MDFPLDEPGGPGGGRGWIDSHCHLQDHYRDDGSVDDALRDAVAAGVSAIICVGTDAETSSQAVALVRDLREGAASDAGGQGFRAWATVGLHPHDASNGLDAVMAVLDEALDGDATRGSSEASDDREPATVVAVGECGLDYHYDHSPRQVQREMFARQIGIAHTRDLTLVVHTRAAWDDTLAILRSEGVPARTVMHCFTGGPGEAEKCLELGAFLSFSGIVTFKNADDVRAAAARCPEDRLLVETDAPFLAPVPHRGEQNRPALVAVVGAAVAEVRGVTPNALAARTWDATAAAFALDE